MSTCSDLAPLYRSPTCLTMSSTLLSSLASPACFASSACAPEAISTPAAVARARPSHMTASFRTMSAARNETGFAVTIRRPRPGNYLNRAAAPASRPRAGQQAVQQQRGDAPRPPLDLGALAQLTGAQAVG